MVMTKNRSSSSFYKTLILLAVFLVSLAAISPVSAQPSSSSNGDSGNSGETNPIVPYIVGGVPALPGAYPATVAVVGKNGSEYRQFCAGTLISSNVVLTAAHCGEQNDYHIDITGLAVVAGRTDLSQPGGELIPVRSMLIHPNWNRATIQADLALFYLKRPVTVVDPVGITTLPSEPNWAQSPQATLLGWGLMNWPGSSTHILQQLAINILSDTECANRLGNSYQTGLDLCGGELGSGICNGDSGGPLYATNRNGNTALAGIISRGRRECATDPGIMTRVAPYAEWISANTVDQEDPGGTNDTPDTARLSGGNRWETAAAIAASAASAITAQSGSAPLTVFLASGTDFPDALAASAIAGATNGVVLLAEQNALPTDTATALTLLAPAQVVVVGGERAIAQNTLEAAAQASGVTPTRIFGPDRYATAAALSRYAFPDGADIAYVTLGTDFSDAVAAGPPAGIANAPVLLSEQSKLPAATRAELERIGPNKIIVLGGTKAISRQVANELSGIAPIKRTSGARRYETSAALSKASFAPGVHTVYLATGQDFPDALVFGPLGAVSNSPVLLVEPDQVSPAVIAEIKRLAPSKIVALGGTKAVSNQVVLQLLNAL